nr:hypothetical protein [Agarophyton chilense]
MRGINIGYINRIQIQYNYVLVKASINASSILIPKNSLVETTQTGLLNDTVVDITPLENISIQDIKNVNVYTQSCMQSMFLCHFDYIKGERGLNYDDLVRAATRISQRLDDPILFQLTNLFLQNTINISNEFIELTDNIVNITILLYDYLSQLLLNQR